MPNSVTVKDIARRAEVSVGTVSRVFHSHANVTEEMRQRVLRAARDLGYSKQVMQDTRREGHQAIKEIGFLYCSSVDTGSAISNPFWSPILHGVEAEARKTNSKVTYRDVGHLVPTPQLLRTTLQEMQLGGILLVGPAEAETIQLIKEINIPLVLVDNFVRGLKIDTVLCDNFEGARMAVEHLLQQGHRQIAFIGGPATPGPRPIQTIYTIERRAAGYRTALLDSGIPVDYSLTAACTLSTNGGYQACKALLQAGTPFTALFCANDETAIGAMKALREAGRSIPEDVSIVGFDDIAMVEHLTPALTTVHVDKEALGSIAVKRLLMQAADPDMVSSASIINVELVKRASVAPRRA